MRQAISKHLLDFLAILVLFALATGVGAYILNEQRLRFPIVEDKPFELKAELEDAQAVTPGQGQTVNVAGVEIGEISKVELENGRAVITLALEPEYERLVHADASALLRPRTGLKDMFVELEPGTKRAPVLKEGERIKLGNTAPDVDPDEILSALDSDTRAYLKLLVSGAGKGLAGRGNDLKEVFRRLEPLHRDLARVTTAIAERRENLSRLIHNYGSLTDELGDKDDELATLVEASNATFEALASEDQNVSATVAKLPGTLEQAQSTLAKVDRLGRVLGPSLEALRPPFRRLATANRELLPFVREAEPITRRRIRPFVRSLRPFVRDLRPASRDLADAAPDFTASFGELNRFFNMAAFNPRGREKVSGNLEQDLNRDEGYLFWTAWVVHLTNSLFSTSDASGSLRRSQFFVPCDTLRTTLEEETAEEPALQPIIDALPLLNDPELCGGPGP